MSSWAPKAALLAFVALGLMWPVAGDRIKALVTPDAKGCAHSSDLPDPDRGKELRAAILCLLNEEREAAGLPPLARDPVLERAATDHARDMGRRSFYAHENPSGLSPDQRMREAGFDGQTSGENIHWGVGSNATPARIMRDWMESPGHRENILRPSFTRVGIGFASEPPEFMTGGLVGVYVQNFGG